MIDWLVGCSLIECLLACLLENGRKEGMDEWMGTGNGFPLLFSLEMRKERERTD